MYDGGRERERMLSRCAIAARWLYGRRCSFAVIYSAPNLRPGARASAAAPAQQPPRHCFALADSRRIITHRSQPRVERAHREDAGPVQACSFSGRTPTLELLWRSRFVRLSERATRGRVTGDRRESIVTVLVSIGLFFVGQKSLAGLDEDVILLDRVISNHACFRLWIIIVRINREMVDQTLLRADNLYSAVKFGFLDCAYLDTGCNKILSNLIFSCSR